MRIILTMPRGVGMFLAASLALASCVGGASSGDERPTVVASFFPLAEVASIVGGDRVRVVDLTPPGAEPHDLEPSPIDVETVLAADLVVYLGAGFQPALEEIVSGGTGPTIDVLEAAGGSEDPHVWLDPVLMGLIAERVGGFLADLDPAGTSTYRENARAYGDELGALDASFARGLRTCESRTIVTAHDAFGVLADRYHLRQETISGVSPEAEPDPAGLADLADLVRREEVTTIFAEPLVTDEAAQTLARETGVLVEVLNPIEGLLPEERERGETYLSLMEENLAVLRIALRCE